MENILTIESPQNPRVKAAVKLRKAKARKESRQTLVEGFREILRASENGWNFKELYFCPELYMDPKAKDLVCTVSKGGTSIFQCSEPAFKKMSYRDTPDGLLALSPLVGKTFDELELPEKPLVLVAENLEKPGNLGTILRTADATGVDAVIVCGNKTDINNPNVIRASIGTLFFIPVVEASTSDTIDWLDRKQIQSIAAVPDASCEYTDVDMLKATAFIVGAEDDGLTREWLDSTDLKVGIPMLGKNDSLNVATASAILLYEAIRQRRKA